MKLDETLSLKMVPVLTAIENCESWRTQYPDMPRSFFIPLNDIIALASYENLGGIVGARAYLALKTPGDPGSAHLLFVPARSFGLPNPTDLLREDGLPPGETYIHDLTQPCPHQCDDFSPLNGAVEIKEVTE